MPKSLNLTGQKFGNLKAISKAPSRNGHTYWLCECLLCGNQKEIQTSHLTSGATTSCGCVRRELNFGATSDKKTCLLCKQEFIPNNKARLYCFDCSPSGLSAKEAIKFKKRRLKHLLVLYKDGKCENCGYDSCEGALQFHHKNPAEKEFSVSQVNLNDTSFSIDKVFLEIDKCSLLCANCHAELHYNED